MDAAACIGCGACVAACKSASAMLFVGAKVSHLTLLPQGKIEAMDRVLDIHIKDEDKADETGKTCEIGHGIIDIPGFLKMLVKENYSKVVSFEFEKDGKDPLAGLAESVGYVRGVLKMIT